MPSIEDMMDFPAPSMSGKKYLLKDPIQVYDILRYKFTRSSSASENSKIADWKLIEDHFTITQNLQYFNIDTTKPYGNIFNGQDGYDYLFQTDDPTFWDCIDFDWDRN